MTKTSAPDTEATRLRRQIVDPLPAHERRLELAGISTPVLEGGEGPPVVLLHGHGEFGPLWGRVVPDLVRDHRVIAPDLPGHGASEVDDVRLDATRTLDWLGTLLDATVERPATLVGHLIGGAMAARFAAAHPRRVDRLVLVDSFGLGSFRPAASFALAMLGFVVRPTEKSQERLFQRCFVDLDGLRDEMGPRMELLEAYALDRARDPGVKAAIPRLMRHFGLPRIGDDVLQRIACPVALIWGRHDLQVRLPVAEAAAARHGWPLHVIDGAGDDPAVEQPAAFLSALRGVLAGGAAQDAASGDREVKA